MEERKTYMSYYNIYYNIEVLDFCSNYFDV